MQQLQLRAAQQTKDDMPWLYGMGHDTQDILMLDDMHWVHEQLDSAQGQLSPT
jgi:hypothetical protein